MNSRFVAASAAIVSLLAVVFSGIPGAYAAPPQPHNYFGTARDASSTPLALGTPITTWVDGVDYSNATTVYAEPPGPNGNYDVDVFGDNQTDQFTDNTPTIKTGADINDEVLFAAGDLTTYKSLNPQQIFTAKDFWGVPTTGQSENLDLTLAQAVNQPSLPKIGRIVTQPNDPWEQYVYLCNPTTSDIVMTGGQYYLEKDDPATPTYFGPTHPITGTIPAGLILYVNLTSWSVPGTTLVPEGDALKLVWNNNGSAFGTSDVVVDRVEYNSTTFTTQFIEPVNTIMTDALAPGLGQEIRRIGTDNCQDTNSNSVDFGIQGATPRPVVGNNPPAVTMSTPAGVESWTGLTVHRIFWNQSDEDPNLSISIDLFAGGPPLSVYANAAEPNGARFFDWTVNCVDSTTAFLRARVTDSSASIGQDDSATFEIDCTAPTLVSTIPPDTQTNVDINADLVLTFSEGMNQLATDGAIVFSPLTAFSTNWGMLSEVTVNPTAALAPSTLYTVTVGCAAKDDSDPGNQLASCPEVFSFTTGVPSAFAPTVDLTEPDGGEVWSSSTAHLIFWNMSDSDTPGNLGVTLEYSTNGPGGPWNPIGAPLSRPQGQNTLAWTVPCADTTTARVRVTVSDGALSSQDVSVANFEIDCAPPTVISTSPGDTANDVLLTAAITIIFSEPMNQGSVQAAFGLAPTVTGIGFNWVQPDTVDVTHSTAFATCTQYTGSVAATARDDSAPGNTLASAFSWTFRTVCPPVVAITAPTSTAVLSGGRGQTLVYTITDTPSGSASVWINWTSPSSQVIGTTSVASNGNPNNQAFTTLTTDTSSATIQVTAQDTTGQVDSETVTFTIDATPPTVQSSVPANGTTNVVATAPFTITFSEKMNRTETQAAISLAPAAGTLTFTWTSDSLLSIAHSQALATNTWYNLTVGTAAEDSSSPGNALGTLYRTTFRTSAAGAVTADAGGPYTGDTGTSVALDGSASTGAIVNWTWEMTRTGGGATIFAYGSQPGVTFTIAGTYTVQLTVRDASGNTATDQTTATITTRTGVTLADLWWVFLIIILAILGLLIFLLMRRRKKDEGMPPEVPPEQVQVTPPKSPSGQMPPPPPAAAPRAQARGGPNTKPCPSCGTIVDAADTECFMCGAKL